MCVDIEDIDISIRQKTPTHKPIAVASSHHVTLWINAHAVDGCRGTVVFLHMKRTARHLQARTNWRHWRDCARQTPSPCFRKRWTAASLIGDCGKSTRSSGERIRPNSWCNSWSASPTTGPYDRRFPKPRWYSNTLDNSPRHCVRREGQISYGSTQWILRIT